MDKTAEEIRALAKEKDALILAHYYVDEKIQEIADFVGDSYALAKKAISDPRKTIVFCGVTFMGESASILNPDKTVLVPDLDSVCPMALMVNKKDIEDMRAKYDDLAVVCYINSMADVKALSDVCVTSSNALKIVKSLPNKNIFFIPDGNLGRFVAREIPEKNIILNKGYCHVHTEISPKALEALSDEHPEAEILAHPECNEEVSAMADYLGSTKEIIEYATASDKKEFIICTENGVNYELKKQNPGKTFYYVSQNQECPNMKRLTLQKVLNCLKTKSPEIRVSKELRTAALKPLEKMLELAK
ncbi:MAG: quinolinate synthase NadA [Lachnospiraceae bacterium]|nr:quinolinate synthase NadA [Lachnospiraceae bacterium]